MSIVKTYYQLAKPGIIYGNLLAASGGYFLAAQKHLHPGLFLSMLVGLALIIGSACVFNNYLDRDIDGLMKRTQKRALVVGVVSTRISLIYATILGLLGSVVLGLFTNLLTLSIAVLGHFFYVVVYGYFKRRSVHGTLIGCISGAIPPIVGYTAITHHLDLAALLLFLILVTWQMPHFYAIALYRLRDYASAHIPVMPLVQGQLSTKWQIVSYIVTYLAATTLLAFFGYAGLTYLVLAILAGAGWLWIALKGFAATNLDLWAHQTFRASLVVTLVWFVSIPLDALIR